MKIENNNLLKEIIILDSIHLATTLLFKNYSGNDFILFTYDKKMIKLAKKLGIKIGF